MKQNGNFRITVLFYDYYSIYIIIPDFKSMIYNS